MNKKYKVNSELAKFSTEDLLEELLYRDSIWRQIFSFNK